MGEQALGSLFSYYCRVCSVALASSEMERGLCPKHASEPEKRLKMQKMWDAMAEVHSRGMK